MNLQSSSILQPRATKVTTPYVALVIRCHSFFFSICSRCTLPVNSSTYNRGDLCLQKWGSAKNHYTLFKVLATKALQWISTTGSLLAHPEKPPNHFSAICSCISRYFYLEVMLFSCHQSSLLISMPIEAHLWTSA